MLRDWPDPKPDLVVCDELAPDSRPTANVLLLKVVDQIYTLPSQAPTSAPPTTR